MMMTMRRLAAGTGLLVGLAAGWAQAAEDAAPLRLPASTAYVLPNPSAARVSAAGIGRWTSTNSAIVWAGTLKTNGALQAALTLRLPTGVVSKLRLTVGDQTREVAVTGNGSQPVTAEFGAFEVKAAGTCRLSLTALNEMGQPNGDLEALTLSGGALQNAHFNLQPRRAAATALLNYVEPADQVTAFHGELTVTADPAGTRFIACGWNRGQLGLGVSPEGEHQVIFSVWNGNADTNTEPQIKPIQTSEGVIIDDAGEQAGGQCHFVYPWKTGERHRFAITAHNAGAGRTLFAGYWFHPERKQWMQVAVWEASGGAPVMTDLYSFIENNDARQGLFERKARFGNLWAKADDKPWQEVVTATFSFDGPGHRDRLDRSAALDQNDFVLATGGFVPDSTAHGASFTHPAGGKAPDDFQVLAIKH